MIQLALSGVSQRRLFLIARSHFTVIFPHPSHGCYWGFERDLPPMFGLAFRHLNWHGPLASVLSPRSRGTRRLIHEYIDIFGFHFRRDGLSDGLSLESYLSIFAPN